MTAPNQGWSALAANAPGSSVEQGQSKTKIFDFHVRNYGGNSVPCTGLPLSLCHEILKGEHAILIQRVCK